MIIVLLGVYSLCYFFPLQFFYAINLFYFLDISVQFVIFFYWTLTYFQNSFAKRNKFLEDHFSQSKTIYVVQVIVCFFSSFFLLVFYCCYFLFSHIIFKDRLIVITVEINYSKIAVNSFL